MTIFKLISIALVLALFFNYSCIPMADNSKSIGTASTADIVQKDTVFNGLYRGLEYMGITVDPAHPGKKFKSYHLGYLKIKGDSVYLDQSPIFVWQNDTTYSASDGGFYYYSGTLQKKDTSALFDLKELFCDYCGVPANTDTGGMDADSKRTKKLNGRFTGKGFIINGYLYAKTTKEGDLISEHSGPYLKSQ